MKKRKKIKVSTAIMLSLLLAGLFLASRLCPWADAYIIIGLAAVVTLIAIFFIGAVVAKTALNSIDDFRYPTE